MSFKRAPRADGSVVPISDEMARFARGTAPTAQDRAHQEAMERASKTEDDEVPKVMGDSLVRARYKIEITFGPKRTSAGPNVIHLRFFESGRRFHGGGDDMMFICRNPLDERDGCGSFIPPDCITGDVAMCPGCKRAVKAAALTEYLIANFTTRRLAQELVVFFHRLGGQADLYCKYNPDDIRYQVMVQQLGSKRAHELRGMHIYPLHRIIRDASAGANLEGRFFAFLTA